MKEAKEAKTVNMSQPKEYSKEEIMNIAGQLQQALSNAQKEIEKYREIIDNLNMGNMFKRLDYLFKVLEFKHEFEVEFVGNSAKEIVEIMTPIKEESSDSK